MKLHFWGRLKKVNLKICRVDEVTVDVQPCQNMREAGNFVAYSKFSWRRGWGGWKSYNFWQVEIYWLFEGFVFWRERLHVYVVLHTKKVYFVGVYFFPVSNKFFFGITPWYFWYLPTTLTNFVLFVAWIVTITIMSI